MRFTFATAQSITFGAGVAAEAPAAALALGRRILLVTGARLDRAASLRTALEGAGAVVEGWCVAGEPTVDQARAGVARARDLGIEGVVAIGGGSALDAGKAIAALVPQPGDAMDYLEVVGDGQPLSARALPVVALPTTAGTGSEVTRNAVLGVPEQSIKVSLRHPSMLPAAALVDPLLTHDMPPALTAATGMDALTQLLEPFFSPAASPFTEALCREALPRIAWALPRAFAQGSDGEAREAMAFASLCGGMALTSARLGAVHGFAAPLGGRFPAPHGALCAALLPGTLAVNLRALQARQPGAPALSRMAEAAFLLTGKASAQPEDLLGWLRTLQERLEIRPLSAWGVNREALPALEDQAARTSSMQGNPIALTAEERLEILVTAL